MTTEVRHDAAQFQRPSRRAATIEEFWSLPESVLRTEYIDGEIITAPAPTVPHQTLLRNMVFRLHEFALRNKLGECFFSPLDVVLPNGDVVQPDVIFLPVADAAAVRGAKRINGAPPLLVEILSPGSVRHDTLTKRSLYERNGVSEYWIVDPDTRTLVQLLLRGAGYAHVELGEADVVRSEVLAGFEAKIADLLGPA